MPFRDEFDCLWCGRKWTTQTANDLEGWASLCPDCLGRAQENPFLRSRLRAALRERGASAETVGGDASGNRDGVDRADRDQGPAAIAIAPDDDEMLRYYAARAPEYDDWYLRRGRYARGPVLDLPWHIELDQVTQWLDARPLHGEIVELAAGTGWWSPLLAQKGELSIYDAVPEPLELARQRLVAHGLRAHLHVRDAWDEPDRPVDAVFCGFWLSHIPRARLDEFLRLVTRWLKPEGVFAFIDSKADPESGAVDHDPVAADGTSLRRLADGREFRIPKVYYRASELESELRRAGFQSASVTETARFFLMGMAAR